MDLGKMSDKLNKSQDISNYVIKSVKQGLTVREIFGGIQGRFIDAPASITTFYKYYKEDMDRARADIVGAIGGKVVDQALEGDFKSQELFLRSRGGWSPQSTVSEVDADSADDELNAIETLARLLGKAEELEALSE